MSSAGRWSLAVAACSLSWSALAQPGTSPDAGEELEGGAAPAVALSAAPGAADAGMSLEIAEEEQACFDCHGEADLSIDLPSGETRSLFVDKATFLKSVHGGKVRCADCHGDMSDVPHPKRKFQNLREFTLANYEQCKRCHFANYTKTLDGVHYALLAKGRTNAALCVDCHGAHDIGRPTQPRSRVSKTCAQCHKAVSETYAKGVHGAAMFAGNPDVPVCTDCHRAHDIRDARTGDWRLKSPEVCGSCHTNAALMQKYGLSDQVVQTYLSDFHGVTASLQRAQGTDRKSFAALCTDCHGIHDITRVKDPNSKVMKANLVQTCRKCHADATEDFPAAWLSHYQPTWDKAPLVWGVQVFYKVLIPFMIVGLVLQIVLHLWRVAVDR